MASTSTATRTDGADVDLALALPADPPPAELGATARALLLALYAPVVLLAPDEPALPANVEWYLARSRLERPASRGIRLTSLREAGLARLRPVRAARGGSADPADWTSYGHVYRARDGGVLVQYWLFFAYNEFHGFGDHEADWEHVTVRLGPRGEPLGAWYARHDENAPGRWFAWDALSREGAHPVVLSARGSHACYARRREVRWFDETCPAERADDAARRGCRVWRTWLGSTGGVVDLGSRREPAVPYLLWPGRWGADGGVGDREGGPPGPAYQPGWCSGGAASCS